MTQQSGTHDFKIRARVRVGHERGKSIRRGGMIPAVLYGHNIENLSIAVPSLTFMKVYRGAGENTLVDLVLEGREPVKVLIHDVDHDAVTNAVEHIDFYQVNMTEKIEAEIPLRFVGESSAVKELGGTLVVQLDAIPVKCLPHDLIQFVEVDISSLKEFDQSIHVGDLNIPPSLEALKRKGDVVVMVSPPRAEEPVPAPVEAPIGEVLEPAQGGKEGTSGGEKEQSKKAS